MSAGCSRRPVLVLGIGNILLRDEGVGVRVIEQMQKYLAERLVRDGSVVQHRLYHIVVAGGYTFNFAV
ncbi:MAG: hypothetical protein ACYTBX_09760 [Planctomycetota bacterium]|jgi:Ni,Fe-hydrogenase maturation factor